MLMHGMFERHKWNIEWENKERSQDTTGIETCKLFPSPAETRPRYFVHDSKIPSDQLNMRRQRDAHKFHVNGVIMWTHNMTRGAIVLPKKDNTSMHGNMKTMGGR
jgi:hypothetical protein